MAAQPSVFHQPVSDVAGEANHLARPFAREIHRIRAGAVLTYFRQFYKSDRLLVASCFLQCILAAEVQVGL